MKKIIYLLLLVPFLSIGQTANGTETKVNAIRALTPQTVTAPTYLTTMGTDGTMGKVISVMNQNANSGILSGGGLAVNADPTKWDLTGGTGYISNSLTGVVTSVTWATQTALTTPYRTTSVATYVLINSAGATVLQNTAPTQQQFRTHIYIGKLAHTTLTNILFAVTEPSRMFDTAGQVSDLNRFLGSGNVDGNVVTYNGANLNINCSAGMTYRAGANYLTDRNSPSITSESTFTAGTFRNKFRNGAGGWNAVNTTTIDPNYYDDGTGILAVTPNNKWTVKVFWRFGGTGTIHVDYGQIVYDTKADALASIGRAVVVQDPDNVRDASRRGWLVVKQGATALNGLDAEFVLADKFGERSTTTATGNLQTAYDNSLTPQITTSTGLGSLDLKRGSASDTDKVFRVLNGAGTETFGITGAGNITAGTYNSYTPANDASVVHLAGTETITGAKTFSGSPLFDLGARYKTPSFGYQSITAANNGWLFGVGSVTQSLLFNGSTNYEYTFPNTTGMLALTSDLSVYLPLTGGILSGGLNGTTAIFSSSATANSLTASNTNPILTLKRNNSATNAAGAINFTTSDNTLKWQIGVNQTIGTPFEINEGAINRFNIAVGGNVLINTTTDNGVDKLQVNGSGIFVDKLSIGNYNNSSYLFSAKGRSATDNGMLVFAGNSSSNSAFVVGDYATNSLFSIKGNGITSIANLSGTGTRTVIADASGNLSASDAASTGAAYTPTLSNTVNVTSTTLEAARYTRIGDVITVTVSFTTSVTTGGNNSQVTLTLPVNRVATATLTVGDITGVVSGGNDYYGGIIQVLSSGTEARLYFKPSTSGTNLVTTTFQYNVN